MRYQCNCMKVLPQNFGAIGQQQVIWITHLQCKQIGLVYNNMYKILFANLMVTHFKPSYLQNHATSDNCFTVIWKNQDFISYLLLHIVNCLKQVSFSWFSWTDWHLQTFPVKQFPKLSKSLNLPCETIIQLWMFSSEL